MIGAIGGRMDMASSFFEFLHVNKHKTFRPKKKFPVGTLRYHLHKQAQATLHSGMDLRSAVRLPPGENMDDWLAVHTVDFFNRINLLYGILTDVCVPSTCPTMSGGPRYEYLWQDGVKYKKPTRLPAKEYMYLLMEWIEERINDETIFPSNTNIPFPPDFRQTCKKILSRLYRIFVHIYIHHFDRLVQIGAEPHANTLYKHFYYFVTEHQLVTQRELDALKDLTARLVNTSSSNASCTSVQQQAGFGPAAAALRQALQPMSTTHTAGNNQTQQQQQQQQCEKEGATEGIFSRIRAQ